jgi:DnaJ-class molecular chaperone
MGKCTRCDGKGSWIKEEKVPAYKPCSSCKGSGSITQNFGDTEYSEYSKMVTCPKCEGNGKTPKWFSDTKRTRIECQKCQGTGKD